MEEISDARPLTHDDDCEEFTCGRGAVDTWLRRHGWRAHRDGTSRINVVADEDAGLIAGFVALSATQIDRAWLPKSEQRNRPEALPGLLIGQLGVDIRYQRRGISKFLMQFALRTCVYVSREVGCFAVVIHPLDEDLRAYYRRFGFRDMPFDAAGSMVARIRDLIHNGFGR